jgi:predicted Rossmann-fold nucleotide-binding protein
VKFTTVLVCGGRDYRDKEHVYKVLDQIYAHYGELVIINGGAGGADSYAHGWAIDRAQHHTKMMSLWDRHQKAGGVIRNSAMLALRPNLVIAFPGGPGTANMVKQARAAGVETYEV